MPRMHTALTSLAAAAAGLAMLAGTAAADRLDEIKSRGRRIVGVTESSPPFSFRDGARGIVGYGVDRASEVAKRLHISIEKIPLIRAERIPSLQQDPVDLLATGMTRAQNRKRDIAFSLAYLDSPHKVLVRTGADIT